MSWLPPGVRQKVYKGVRPLYILFAEWGVALLCCLHTSLYGIIDKINYRNFAECNVCSTFALLT